MDRTLIALSLPLLIATACIGGGTDDEPADTDVRAGTQPCATQVTDPILTVTEYDWNGETVYYFGMNCCDQFNPVYDQTCTYICAPDGGFAVQGDGQCVDFFTEATAGSQVFP